MKNQASLISVIVPNYNHENYLLQRLESIFNQTYSNFEVIILDDKSTDNSKEIISQYSEHNKVSHCLFNETNSGSTFKQWNKGIGLAKGDFIWIAETDDFCETNFLETLIQPLIDNDCVALSYCQSYRTNNNNVVTGNWVTHTSNFQHNPLKDDFIMEGNTFIERYLIHKNIIPNVSAVLIRRKDIQRIMPLIIKPFMKYNADWIYYFQIIYNKDVAFIAKPLNYFRYHETSVIAKAQEESSLLRILKDEFKTRVFIYIFLKVNKLKNIKSIAKQYKIGNEKLQYKIVAIFIEKKQYVKAIYNGLSSVSLFKKVLINIFRRI